MLGEFPLKDKIVAITGGGSGIGLAFVKYALSLDARVLIGDLSLTTDAEKLIAQQNKDSHKRNGSGGGGGDAVRHSVSVAFTPCDVAKWDQLQNLIDKAKEVFGDVPDPRSNFWLDREQEEDRYATVDINVTHPIKFTRMAMRALLGHKKEGVVLLISSIAGLDGVYSKPLYAAAKHAIVGFVRSMSVAEQQFGIKVVGICPGIVDTPIWNDEGELLSCYQPDRAQMLRPELIAASMMKLIQKGEYTGGTVYLETGEVSKVVYKGFENDPGNITAIETLPGVRLVGKQMRKQMEML
ncbi:NAD-dependent 15-hydroxyprostaglandin dehydrogenase [Histoplasma capsulatum var. duboisii H88]|uniref:NAD-dependent 15-hydroxyprostaglandin dehydrogenase n=3 Tax=Ajellomyces capsulatus TaxID=5037 RepID=F0U9Z2_AJEC8|nr:NAD-dependent 15-hydroxyprostaglandin dehydrogenase [Histoplasma capsulatum H143]EGC43605.1 NAD-dependent 15-hydroxyprostaglandin dehydrogenase [Histoplasma capsulatum var. duboisii H88]